MAVTRSKSLKQRIVATVTSNITQQTIPKPVKKRVGKAKNSTTSTRKAAKKSKIGKGQTVTQSCPSIDAPLPLQMVSIPTDVVYTLNLATMQHFVVNDCVDMKEETDTSVDNTLPQPSNHSIDPLRRDSTAVPITASESTVLKEEFVETIRSAEEMNVRSVADSEDYGIANAETSAYSSLSPTNVDPSIVVKEESQCHWKAFGKDGEIPEIREESQSHREAVEEDGEIPTIKEEPQCHWKAVGGDGEIPEIREESQCHREAVEEDGEIPTIKEEPQCHWKAIGEDGEIPESREESQCHREAVEEDGENPTIKEEPQCHWKAVGGDGEIPEIREESQSHREEVEEDGEIPTIKEEPQCHSKAVGEDGKIPEIREESQCHREASVEDDISTELTPGHSTPTVPLNCETVHTSQIETAVARISSPVDTLIREKCRTDDSNHTMDDLTDHSSHIPDVNVISLVTPAICSSHILETTVHSTPGREFSYTEPIQSSHCSTTIDRYVKRRLSVSPREVDSERMGVSGQQELDSSQMLETKTHSRSALHDSHPNDRKQCPSPANTIIKDEISPTKTIVKSELTDECLSPLNIEIESDVCSSPTRTIIKSESEDECPSPARTIIKNDRFESTSPISMNAENVGLELLDNYIQEHRSRIESTPPVTEHSDIHSKLQTGQSSRRSSLDNPLEKPSAQQRCSVERRHRKSLSSQTSNERCYATTSHWSSSKAWLPANKICRFHNQFEYDESFRERSSESEQVYESDNSESDCGRCGRNCETGTQRPEVERHSNEFSSPSRNKRNGYQWPDLRLPVTPEKVRIESDTTDNSEPDYGWEDPPPPKRKCVKPKLTQDVDPKIHEKMQMFIGKLNDEFDLDVIEESRKELFRTIKESIALQSARKLVELDQKIRKKKDEHFLNLFGTDDFNSWNTDPALGNVEAIKNLRPCESSADASLLDNMTMKHWKRVT